MAARMEARCSEVVPQQPPIILTPASIAIVAYFAIRSGVPVYTISVAAIGNDGLNLAIGAGKTFFASTGVAAGRFGAGLVQGGEH